MTSWSLFIFFYALKSIITNALSFDQLINNKLINPLQPET